MCEIPAVPCPVDHARGGGSEKIMYGSGYSSKKKVILNVSNVRHIMRTLGIKTYQEESVDTVFF